MFDYPDKPKDPNQEKIESILSNSDIVWGRYGSDTIEELAKRILASIKN